MIDITVVFAFIGTVLLFLSTPGPVTVMVINNSSRQGFLAGLATIAGTNTASLVLIAISFLVLYGVLAVSEYLLTWLTLFGSLYLLYYAIQLIKESFSAKPLSFDETNIKTTGTNKASQSYPTYFRQGLFVGVSNPKDILFFMAFFPLFFNVSANIKVSMLVLTLLWVILDYAILSLYSVIFAKIKHQSFVAWVGKLSGVLLFAVAIFGIYKTTMSLGQVLA